MKKILSLMVFAASTSAFAGGLLTNTNQNAAFLRNMAQEGQIDITSIYANPAGGAFLSNGWHLSLNSQTAIQQRNITTTFPYFKANMNSVGQPTHDFKGDAFAPVIPSFTVSYNRDKWSVSAHFGLTGGGGKCEFDKGLGSFETIVSAIPGQVMSGIKDYLIMTGKTEQEAALYAPMLGPDCYSYNSHMRGRNYDFGLQIGGTYKITNNLSAYLGVRGVYVTCNYNGYVGDLQLANSTSKATALPNDPAYGPMAGVAYTDLVRQEYGADPTIELDCDQTGFAVTPIIGIDWKINDKWNVSAKYECPTGMKLKNSTKMSKLAGMLSMTEDGKMLAQFADGQKVREDIPGILAFGAQYAPIEKVRLSAGFHEYFDKAAKKFGDKQKGIDHNTYEINFGAEYDFCKYVTVSASWQTTQYGLSDAYMNDLSFNLSNHMIGCGVRVHATKRLNIDLGYMHTFYQSRDVVDPNPKFMGAKKDHYVRKNDVIGIGVNLAL